MKRLHDQTEEVDSTSNNVVVSPKLCPEVEDDNDDRSVLNPSVRPSLSVADSLVTGGQLSDELSVRLRYKLRSASEKRNTVVSTSSGRPRRDRRPPDRLFPPDSLEEDEQMSVEDRIRSQSLNPARDRKRQETRQFAPGFKSETSRASREIKVGDPVSMLGHKSTSRRRMERILNDVVAHARPNVSEQCHPTNQVFFSATGDGNEGPNVRSSPAAVALATAAAERAGLTNLLHEPQSGVALPADWLLASSGAGADHGQVFSGLPSTGPTGWVDLVDKSPTASATNAADNVDRADALDLTPCPGHYPADREGGGGPFLLYGVDDCGNNPPGCCHASTPESCAQTTIRWVADQIEVADKHLKPSSHQPGATEHTLALLRRELRHDITVREHCQQLLEHTGSLLCTVQCTDCLVHACTGGAAHKFSTEEQSAVLGQSPVPVVSATGSLVSVTLLNEVARDLHQRARYQESHMPLTSLRSVLDTSKGDGANLGSTPVSRAAAASLVNERDPAESVCSQFDTEPSPCYVPPFASAATFDAGSTVFDVQAVCGSFADSSSLFLPVHRYWIGVRLRHEFVLLEARLQVLIGPS